jgi:hypothetical protein
LQEFFHDYGALIAPTAAIVNGFIAVVVAQFFKNRPWAKVLLVAAAGLLGVGAIGATFYSQNQIVAERAAEARREREIRAQIGVFIADGLDLMRACADASKPPPVNEVNAWVDRIAIFFHSRMDDSYAVRVTSPSGVPIVSLNGGDKEHTETYRIIYAVNFHLEQISQQAKF